MAVRGTDARLWARIGITGFGGPAGQIAIMHREIVQRRDWLSEDQFAHALSFCMLLPGPEAQQLATYIGWRRHGLRGALTAGSLFVLPGALVMLALSWIYVLFGSVDWVNGILTGLQAAVVAIVVQALIRMARRQLTRRSSITIAVVSFTALAFLALPFPLVIAVAALGGWLSTLRQSAERPQTPLDAPRVSTRATVITASLGVAVWLLSVGAVLWLVADSIFPDVALLFSKAAVVTFGGAYAVLGYVAQQAVGSGWLSANQMAVGLGLAETTPGPLILVLQFVGFVAAYENPGALPPLVAGTLGALLTLWVLFLPSMCFVLLGAPFLERLRSNVHLRGALQAIAAAVVGVVGSLALWLAMHTMFAAVTTWDWGPLHVALPDWDSIRWSTTVIAVIGFVLVFALRWGMLRVLAVCALLGLAAAVVLPGV